MEKKEGEDCDLDIPRASLGYGASLEVTFGLADVFGSKTVADRLKIQQKIAHALSIYRKPSCRSRMKYFIIAAATSYLAFHS